MTKIQSPVSRPRKRNCFALRLSPHCRAGLTVIALLLTGAASGAELELDEYLQRPSTDPHGDPIPSADGEMRVKDERAIPLSTVTSGTRVRVVRVVDQGGEFLRFLSDAGVSLRKVGTVRHNSSEAGIVTTEFDGQPISLGLPAAGQILVEPIEE